MNYTKLFEIIDAKKDKYVNFLKEIVEIESPTTYKNGVDAVGRYFIEKAKEKGWKTEIFRQNVAGDVVVITMNPEADNKPICLSGHMDTVHPVGLFGDPCVRFEGNKMIGPGVADCKGGCVSGFWAMDALSEAGYKDRPVMLLLQSDEETSSRESNKETINYIVERSKNAIAFLNLESTITGKATLERKGIAKFDFTVNGKSTHASKCHLGASAIREAAYKIIKLEEYKDVNGITCNCGTIRGGTVSNTVPDECVFTLDTRFKNQEQYKEILKLIHKVAEEKTVDLTYCTVREISVRPCMPKSEKNYKLFDRINEIMKLAGLDEIEKIDSTGGSDAAYTTIAGIPTVDSLGPKCDKVHSIEEYIEIDKFPFAVKQIAAITAGI